MHLATVTRENPLGIAPGEYLCEDISAGEMLACGYANKVRPADSIRSSWDATEDQNGKKILFVRPGGFGDLLFLTPIIAEIKSRWPRAEICVASFDRFRPVLENNPDVDGFTDYPVPVVAWGSFDTHFWLEGIIETNTAAWRTHAVDLISERCGLELKDKGMRYFVTVEERNEAHKEFPREFEQQARIGIQVSASGRCRIYPHILEVARLLWREGHEVFLFGAPGEVKTDTPEGIVNLMSLNKTFRESCAILETCDVLVAPDSALVHVAGALDLPCVALYGPFPWQLRTKYARETFALQGMGACSPCFHHKRPGTGEFPDDGPCARTGRCEVLAAIPVERVVREVAKKLEGTKKHERRFTGEKACAR